MEDKTLLKYVKLYGNQIWIGRKSPYDMDTAELLDSSNYRLSSSHHHRYDVVWFYEYLLDDVGKLGWRIVIDELIRLIKEQGYLIIRMRDNCVPSLPFLKKFLGRHIGIETDVEYEKYDKEFNVWTAVFKIKRFDIEKYEQKDWTFAVLTMGKKVDNVVRFLKTVRDYELTGDSEILIVGPQNKNYDYYHVKYIDFEQFRNTEYAEISKKKNSIIDAATRTNLMIIHDRFLLDENFFKGFEKYGYDFDFLTVTQYTETGKVYPGYAATDEEMRLSFQVWVQDLRHLYDNSYINGGLIIIKTHIAQKIKFNKMLMWNQMEDVELSQVCMYHGIIPRVNFISKAIVLEVSDGYFASWIYESNIDANSHSFSESVAGRIPQKPLFLRLVLKITKHMPSRWKQTYIYRKIKAKVLRGV